jgi:hypothetical protein
VTEHTGRMPGVKLMAEVVSSARARIAKKPDDTDARGLESPSRKGIPCDPAGVPSSLSEHRDRMSRGRQGFGPSAANFLNTLVGVFARSNGVSPSQ